MNTKTDKEKAIAYDEVLGRAKSLVDFCSDNELKTLKFVFPELKENEDERIRNVLIRWINLESSISFGDTFDGFSKEQILAWLEKQCEKPQGKSALDAINEENVDNQNCVKPSVKGEPKFKVGDWCIDNEDGIVFQIVKVLDKTYRYRTNEGKEYSCARYSLELDARFWTIKDANEGDVLVDSLGNVCIYQEPSTKLMYHSHCYGNHKYFIYMGGSHEIVGSYPATKEQRDQLEKAMDDAGYTFDFEKKKLKKLKFKVGDEVITENERSLTITKIDEEGYWSNDLFICDFDNECNWNLVEQKPDDKVEPKFKVGDYVVDNCGYVWRIEGIINQFYILEGIDGGESRPTIEWVNKTFHLWTIQDAKDGDVLVHGSFMFDDFIFIYDNTSILQAYCYYSNEINRFIIEDRGHHCPWNMQEVTPASKEQRDKFEKAMAESGYEFDFDKKELKKIEQNPEYAQLTEFEEAIKDMMNDYRDAIGDSDATTEEVKKHSAYLQSLISQTPAKWGEEDEKNLIDVICILQNITSYDKQYDGYIDWLKSLRPKRQ